MHDYSGLPINVKGLIARVPTQLPVPADSEGHCRELLVEQANEALAFDEHDEDEADLAVESNRQLQRRFNDYVAALIHLAGLDRAEAIRQAAALVEEIAS